MFLESIRDCCTRSPNSIAYRAGEQQIGRKTLWQNALALATFLKENGNKPVLVYGHKSPLMIVSFLGCLLAGRAYVPCDSSTPTDRLRYIHNTCAAGLTLCVEGSCELPDAVDPVTLISATPEPLLKSFEQHADSPAYILFTSGSTGDPKGILITHGNLQNFIDWATSIHAIKSIDNPIVGHALFSFDLSVADLYISLVQGNTHVSLTENEQSDYSLLFNRLYESKVGAIVCTPTFLQLLLLDDQFSPSMFPFLKTIFSCGEVLSEKVADKALSRFPGLSLVNAYGPTEATCAVCAATITPAMLSGALPVGAINSAAARIEIDAPAGESGEIILRGKSVSQGYINAASGGFFEPQSYRTGDIGYIQDGLLYFNGRIDEQIKYKGYRIEPAEIERALESIDGIRRAAVIPILKRGAVIRIVAFAESASKISTQQIKRKLEQSLPSYMIPAQICFLDQLPANANGKLDKAALKRGFENG